MRTTLTVRADAAVKQDLFVCPAFRIGTKSCRSRDAAPPAAAVCGLNPLTSFKLDNGCTASSPTTSYLGCWIPLHTSNAELVPNAPNGASIFDEYIYTQYFGKNVKPATLQGQVGIQVRAWARRSRQNLASCRCACGIA